MSSFKQRVFLQLVITGCLLSVMKPGPALMAQSDRGAITGTVTDPSGAIIGGVSVTATNVENGQKTKTVTGSTGNYTIPFLPAGVYQVTAEQSGFKKHVRDQVTVPVGQTVRQDISLEIGEVTQSVDVKSEAPLLKPETSELGTTIENRQVLDLPLAGSAGEQRSPVAFMQLVPGVTGRGAINNNDRTFTTTINGGQAAGNEIVLEGAPILNSNGPGDFRILGFPQDAVQEFKLTTNNFATELGRTGGGVTSFSFRSGTNQIHGSAYEFFRNDVLNANGFFANQAPADPRTGKAPRSVLRQNEFGFTAGGPILRDKTFAFGWYSGFRFRRASQAGLTSVPTAAFKRGDFSNLTDSRGNRIQLYDPATTRRDSQGNLIRDPFVGNIIPENRFDRVAKNILAFFPDPNVGSGIFNNYLGQSTSGVETNQWGTKIDHAFSERHKINGSFVWSHFSDVSHPALPSPIGPASSQDFPIRIFRLSQDLVLRPNLINHATFGVNRHGYDFSQLVTKDVISKIGFTGVPQDGALMQLNMSDYSNFGGGGPNYQYNTNYFASENLTWIKGKHSLKFGFEFRHQGFNLLANNNETGVFTLDRPQTALPLSASNTGFGLASFELGLVHTGFVSSMIGTLGYRHVYYGFYFQDDFKVTPKLTLNYGLRYDLPFPAVEVANRLSWWDRSVPNPAVGGRLGAYVFATPDRRSGADLDKKEIGPRFGFAYSLTPKTVIRGGYGIHFGQAGATLPTALSYAWDGFVTSNTLPPSSDGFSEAFRLQDGWPADRLPRAPFLNPALQLGSLAAEIRPEFGKAPYIQSWNLNVQREVKGGILMDFAWAGAKGTRLTSRLDWPNALHPKYLSLGSLLLKDIRSPEAVAAGIALPYAGFQGTVAQALRPYPQYFDVRSWWQNYGQSTYHAFQMKIDKRFSAGLNLLAAYTWSKSLSNGDSQLGVFSGMTQSTYNYQAEKGLSINDYPHNLVVSYSYDLPFGPGKSYLDVGGVAGKLVGGWKVSGIQQYQEGAPIPIVQANRNAGLYIGGTGDPMAIANRMRPNVVPGADRRSSRYHASDFDPSKDVLFNVNAWSEAPQFTIGNAPRSYGDIRRFAYLNEDFAVIKRTNWGEQHSVDFRMEVFNAFNRVVFGSGVGGSPYASNNTENINSAGFGRITAQSNPPRQIQFGIRLNY